MGGGDHWLKQATMESRPGGDLQEGSPETSTQ